MQCCVFGVANHSPEEVVSRLVGSRIAAQASEIGILPPMAKADTRYKYILLLSTSDLSRNLYRFDQTNTKIFVFSNPIDLVSFSGIRNLDFVPVDDFSFNYTELDMSLVVKSPAVPVTRIPSPFLANLIDSVKYGSLLNPLMTFIYSLAAQNQSAVKLIAVSYLYHGRREDYLVSELSKYLTQRAIDKLLAILKTSIAESYTSTFSKIRDLTKRKQSFDLQEVAKEFSTSAYELSYMLSVIASSKGSTYSDSFDKAKNRKSPTGVLRSQPA